MKLVGQYEGVTEGGVVYHVALIDTKDTPMKPNDRQVGGTHYQSTYQHWDWVDDIDMDYLLGCATKYLTRWRSKNGLPDIEKAIHYLDKRIERAGWLARVRRAFINVEHLRAETDVFLAENPQIPPNEHLIFVQLATWKSRKQLVIARQMLESLHQQELEAASAPQLADENDAKIAEAAEQLREVAKQANAARDEGYVSPRAG